MNTNSVKRSSKGAALITGASRGIAAVYAERLPGAVQHQHYRLVQYVSHKTSAHHDCSMGEMFVHC